MKQLNRRDFIKATVATAAAGAAFNSIHVKPHARVIGANDEIRIGIVGFHSHGRTHIRAYQAIPKGVRIVALCDPDQDVIRENLREYFNGREDQVDTYTDLRELLDDPNIDAISGATPNHWHALSTIWACQAGKDVCVEKPVSHNIFEGRKMVEAARKYGRIVQADLDRRSNEGNRMAWDYARNGHLGRILRAHSFVYKRRESIGKVASGKKPPSSVDYNLWCGPSPMGPVMRERFHYDWHWQWQHGGGEAANNGPHTLDEVRSALGYMHLPHRVMGFGGRFGYDDDGNTPNAQVAILDYEPAPIYFETRGLPRHKGDGLMDANHMVGATGKPIQVGQERSGTNNGAVVICEHGYVSSGSAYDNDGKLIKKFEGEGIGHHERFIEAMRTRKLTDLRVDILEGHLSTSLCHLSNIAYRCGEPATSAEIREATSGDPIAAGIAERFEKHLGKNEVDRAKTPIQLGTWLEFDSAKERFTGGRNHAKANKLLSREYREPFVVRENV